jgi:hypothetical protein
MANTIYFTQRPTMVGTDEFIAIEHGTQGYSVTTVYDQDHADVLNGRQELHAAEIEAAMMCSMFGNWDNFDSMVERLSS